MDISAALAQIDLHPLLYFIGAFFAGLSVEILIFRFEKPNIEVRDR
jgi:hypothetical protein